MAIGIQRPVAVFKMLLPIVEAELAEAAGNKIKSQRLSSLAFRIQEAIKSKAIWDQADLLFDPDKPGDVFLWREFRRIVDQTAHQADILSALAAIAGQDFH